MELILTVREIMDAGLWNRVCEIKGYNPWAVNEGLMGGDDTITLDTDECRELGLSVISGYKTVAL